MGYRSTRQCVDDLKRHDQLIVCDDPVSARLQVAEIQRRVFANGGPAVLFTDVTDSRFPMVSNLFGTLERARFLFRDTIEAVRRAIELKIEPSLAVQKPGRYWKAPLTALSMRPKQVRSGAVTKNMTKVDQLPQLVSWPLDAGGFVTLPQVYSEDARRPGLAHSNLGMYRIQLTGNQYDINRQIGLHYQIHRSIGVHHAAARELGKPFRVNIFVGGSPAMTLAAVMPLPEGMSELGFAGALAGHRIPMQRNEGHLPIYADADFCISGTIDPELLLPEGPFGDHLGYYSLAHDFPLITPVESPELDQVVEEGTSSLTPWRLTHDFLVQPIRTWLEKKRRETWRGRAAMQLEELETQWAKNRERRYLPTLPQFVAFTAGVPALQWSAEGKSMWRAAFRFYGLATLLIAGVIAAGGLLVASLISASNDSQIKSLVEQVVVGEPQEASAAIKQLSQYGDAAYTGLLPYLDNDDPKMRFRAAAALLQLGSDDPMLMQTVIDVIPALDTSEFGNTIAALESAPAHHDFLRQAWERTDSDTARARLAITDWHLGNPALLQEMFADQFVRDRQTAVIDQLSKWHGPISQLVEIVVSRSDPDFQYTMCAAIGMITPDELSEPDQQTCLRMFDSLLEGSVDPGVIQVAAWALGQWKQPVSPDLGSAVNATGLPLIRQEMIDGIHLTFVLVEGGEFVRNEGILERHADDLRYPGERVTINQPYYMLATETPFDLFRRFLDDPRTSPEIGSKYRDHPLWKTDTSGLPICNVSRTDTAEFLNWLSDRLQLTEYYRIEDGVVTWDSESNGCRLPDSDQWEFASKAGARTSLYWGTNTERPVVQQYAQVELGSGRDVVFVTEMAQRIPNRFGFFDMIGNALELCDYPPTMPNSDTFAWPVTAILRGGDVRTEARGLCGVVYIPNPPQDVINIDKLGFRVVLPVQEQKNGR